MLKNSFRISPLPGTLHTWNRSKVSPVWYLQYHWRMFLYSRLKKLLKTVKFSFYLWYVFEFRESSILKYWIRWVENFKLLQAMPFLQFPESSYSSLFIIENNPADSTLHFLAQKYPGKSFRGNSQFEFWNFKIYFLKMIFWSPKVGISESRFELRSRLWSRCTQD